MLASRWKRHRLLRSKYVSHSTCVSRRERKEYGYPSEYNGRAISYSKHYLLLRYHLSFTIITGAESEASDNTVRKAERRRIEAVLNCRRTSVFWDSQDRNQEPLLSRLNRQCKRDQTTLCPRLLCSRKLPAIRLWQGKFSRWRLDGWLTTDSLFELDPLRRNVTKGRAYSWIFCLRQTFTQTYWVSSKALWTRKVRSVEQ